MAIDLSKYLGGTTGTWSPFGITLPDYGFTEARAPAQNQFLSNPLVNQYYGSQQAQPGLSSVQNPIVPKTQTGGGGGGGDSAFQQLSKIQRNPVQETEYQNLLKQMQGSAQNQSDAELQAMLDAYDYQRSQLESQSAALNTQRTSALGTIEGEYKKAETEKGKSETQAKEATQSAKNKALSTAQDVTKRNRNVLRAMGILSSSAAGEQLSRPMNEYGVQAADLEKGLVDRLNVINDWWTQRQTDFTKMKTDLETQYTQLQENIANDLRFNDRQRTTAIQAAKAALSQRMNEIQSAVMQYQQSAKQYSDNILMQIAQMKMYQNPSADVNSIYNMLLSGQGGYSPQTIGIQQTDEQRKRLSGLGV
jgi:hypothetical protein